MLVDIVEIAEVDASRNRRIRASVGPTTSRKFQDHSQTIPGALSDFPEAYRALDRSIWTQIQFPIRLYLVSKLLKLLEQL